MGDKLILRFRSACLCACEIMEAGKSRRSQCAHQSGKVLEVMRRSCVGDAGFTSGGSQGQGVDPLALQDFFGG
nr:hypothetical protein [Devosia submarina]